MSQSPVETALANAPAMTALLASQGWGIVADEIQHEMDRCTVQVMEVIDDPEERARLIQRYRNLKECIEKPMRVLEAAKTLIEDHQEAVLGE
jgi:hypothetical protein